MRRLTWGRLKVWRWDAWGLLLRWRLRLLWRLVVKLGHDSRETVRTILLSLLTSSPVRVLTKNSNGKKIYFSRTVMRCTVTPCWYQVVSVDVDVVVHLLQLRKKKKVVSMIPPSALPTFTCVSRRVLDGLLHQRLHRLARREGPDPDGARDRRQAVRSSTEQHAHRGKGSRAPLNQRFCFAYTQRPLAGPSRSRSQPQVACAGLPAGKAEEKFFFFLLSRVFPFI